MKKHLALSMLGIALLAAMPFANWNLLMDIMRHGREGLPILLTIG